MLDQLSPSAAREDELNQALALFHFAFRAFTAKPDQLLAERGLQRLHHRILYFVARNPGIRVNGLLTTLGISKQALHAPLRQLQAMRLVEDCPDATDKRGKCLTLSADGKKLETALSGAQRKLIAHVFEQTGTDGETAWRTVMAALATQLPSATRPSPPP